MVFCTKCGAPQREGTRFCVKCGAGIRAEASKPVENEEQYMYCRKCGNKMPANAPFCPVCGTSTLIPAAPPRDRRKWLIPALGAVALVAVLAAVLALAGLFSPPKPSPANNSDSLRDKTALSNYEKAKNALSGSGASNSTPDAPVVVTPEDPSGVPDGYTYVGESGATFTVTPNHARYRYAFGQPEVTGETVPDLAAWAPDGAELLLTSEKDGYIESFYELKTYNVDHMKLLSDYCELLESPEYGLSCALPLQKTFEVISGGVFPFQIYEAGFDYIGSGSVTEGAVPGEEVSGRYTVHFYAQIQDLEDSVLFLRYPAEMSLVNPPVRFGGAEPEPSSSDSMGDIMTFTGPREPGVDIVFTFSGFHKDDYISFALEDGSFQAGDVYTIEDWGETNKNAIRNLAYDLELEADRMERDDSFNAYELPDRLKKVTLRILEYTDEHAIVYFYFVTLDRGGQLYEIEGLAFGERGD